MAMDFKLPDLGENIEAGDVVSVLVAVGDLVSPNQGVVEIETDKAVVEVPCPIGGRVTAVHVKPGQEVPVGAVLISLEPVGAGAAQPAPQPPSKSASAAPRPAQVMAAPAAQVAPVEVAAPPAPVARSAVPAAPAAAVAGAPKSPRQAAPPVAPAARSGTAAGANGAGGESAAASPAIRRLARELGIEIANVDGTGPEGRITREDVISAVRLVTARPAAAASMPGSKVAPPPGTADQDTWGPVRREKLTKIRKTIAANMLRSTTTIPHVTNFDDADITELERIRKQSAADYVSDNVKLTMMVFVMKAVAHALKLHPTLNATLDGEQDQIIYKEYANIGVAVDTPRGLVVPVIRNVDRMSIPQLAYALTSVSNQARENRFAVEDLRGGTFTVSNLGAVGGTYSTPIINHPEVAVLLTGRSRRLPVVIDERIEPRLMMPLSLSYDHRLVDGATAARFLNEVIGLLQAPGRLLLAP